jgi:methylphosphotriester-DNA--protein-cysteine methyltransferase
MILHASLGTSEIEIRGNLGRLIRNGDITLGGYKKARIYGTLNCRSGKRMKIENRVFFKDEKEAISEGYRPCGHCLPEKYKLWKSSQEMKKS